MLIILGYIHDLIRKWHEYIVHVHQKECTFQEGNKKSALKSLPSLALFHLLTLSINVSVLDALPHV